ncbi:MAG: nucleoside monophosphate kinase [Phycisphaerales bacterium]|nr:nucleoside monophosphate kinase [Phycisphaerales bacterium]
MERPAVPDSTPFQSVVFLGAPGTGKGTQGKVLGAIPGFFHLSTGDMFRALDPASDLGREFLKYSIRGELVPDAFTVSLWQEHMAKLIAAKKFNPKSELLVLDGIPRNANQAKLMDGLVNVLRIVHLDCQDEGELVKRLQLRATKEGRPDDAKEEVVRRRLEVYREETKPVLAHYPERVIATVNAVGTPAEVLLAVLNVLAPVHTAHFANPLS